MPAPEQQTGSLLFCIIISDTVITLFPNPFLQREECKNEFCFFIFIEIRFISTAYILLPNPPNPPFSKGECKNEKQSFLEN